MAPGPLGQVESFEDDAEGHDAGPGHGQETDSEVGTHDPEQGTDGHREGRRQEWMGLVDGPEGQRAAGRCGRLGEPAAKVLQAASSLRTVDEQSVRDAFARHAGGVVVVSARVAAGFRGLTATSFIPVSLEPPLVAIALDHHAATRDAVLDGGVFSVSVLEAAQEFVADRFAGRAPLVSASWSEVAHFPGANGLPVIAGAAAWFECGVAKVVEAGDHDLVIGSITGCGLGTGDPLLLWERGFWRLGGR